MKNKIIWSTIILVGVFIGFLYLNKGTKMDIDTQRQLTETYLRENISELSPEKEVLGGKFYVSSIDWLEENRGKVEYEDGHILLNAEFEYQISADGKGITIDKFEIVK